MNYAVVHLMGSLRPSGMERMLISAWKHWPEKYQNALIIGQGDDHPFSSHLENCGYAVTQTPNIFSYRGLMEFARLARDNRNSVWHIHVEREYLPATVILRLCGARKIVRTVHNTFSRRGFKGKLRSAANSLADKLVRNVIAVSDDVSLHERRYGRRTLTILNWVDDAYFSVAVSGHGRGRAEAPSSFAIVGNCSEIKNHAFALALLPEDAEVVHLGNERHAGPEELRLLNQIEDQGRAIVRGIGDPIDFLTDVDLFLMPSIHEGMGVALAEAVVVGCQVLAADVPGLRWARGFPGVELLPLDADAWRSRLRSTPLTPDAYRSVDELRPSRGVADYVRVYEEVEASCTS